MGLANTAAARAELDLVGVAGTRLPAPTVAPVAASSAPVVLATWAELIDADAALCESLI